MNSSYEYLEKIRDLLLDEMREKEYDIIDLSVKCDISYNRIRNILYGNVTDIKLSTLIKICKSLGIELYIGKEKHGGIEYTLKQCHLVYNGKRYNITAQ